MGWCVQVELPKLQAAISIACRLGFATRLPNPNEGVRSFPGPQVHRRNPCLPHRTCIRRCIPPLPEAPGLAITVPRSQPGCEECQQRAEVVGAADEEGGFAAVPALSLDFDLGSEADLSPTARGSSLGFGSLCSGLDGDEDGHGQGIALVVDAEVRARRAIGSSILFLESSHLHGQQLVSLGSVCARRRRRGATRPAMMIFTLSEGERVHLHEPQLRQPGKRISTATLIPPANDVRR